jgi:hypothetical protein
MMTDHMPVEFFHIFNFVTRISITLQWLQHVSILVFFQSVCRNGQSLNFSLANMNLCELEVTIMGLLHELCLT